MRTLLAVLLLSAAASAAPLGPGGRAVALYGGAAYPGGSVGDLAKLGFSGGASLRRQFTRHAALGLDGEYLRFGDRDTSGGVAARADALAFGAFVRLDAAAAEGRNSSPFLWVGPALTRITRRNRTPAIDERTTEWEPGVAVGIGTLIGLGEHAAFGPSARFRSFGRFGWAISGGLELSFTLAGGEK